MALLMSVDELNSKIGLVENEWVNNEKTNCYAFALGLDIPEDQICHEAYDIGNIARNHLNIANDVWIKMSILDKLYADLKVLGIEYKEIDWPQIDFLSSFDSELYNEMGFLKSEVAAHRLLENSSRPKDWIIKVNLAWIGTMYLFHFQRFGFDGNFYQKKGFGFKPSLVDPSEEITILSHPIQVSKVLKLSLYK